MIGCENDPSRTSDNPQDASEFWMPQEKWKIYRISHRSTTSFEFDEIKPFSNGFAPVSMDGRFGYINENLVVQIQPKFLEAKPFYDGYATVKDQNGHWGIIDSTGHFTLPPLYSEIRFHGKWPALVNQNGSWSFVQKNGSSPFDFPIQNGLPFKDSLTVITTSEGQVLIDQDGHMVSSLFDRIYFTENQALHPFLKNDRWGYLNCKGQIAIASQFQMAQSFVGEYAVVKKNGKDFLINHTGQTVSKLFETPLLNLGHQFVACRQDSLWLVHHLKKTVPSFTVDEIHRFYDQRAVIREGELYNFIEPNGQRLLDDNVLMAWDFNLGFTRILDRSGFAIIDTLGNVLLPPLSLNIRDLNHPDLIAVQNL